MSASTAVNVPLVPLLTVMSLASKPLTPSENWKVKVTGPPAVPGVSSLMARVGVSRERVGRATSLMVMAGEAEVSWADAVTVSWPLSRLWTWGLVRFTVQVPPL